MSVFKLIWVSLVICGLVKLNYGQYEIPRYLKTKYGSNEASTYSPVKSNVKTKTKTAPSSYASSNPASKYRGGCNTPPPTPQNAGIRCSQYSGCRADCLPSYQFPNGATQLFITCENGQWRIDGGIWPIAPSCEPICLPACQNQGICTAPNQCECPENFSGPYCQFENKPCLAYPPLPKNSRRSCSSKSCTVTCLNGHQFPDGSAIATMSCKNGYWLPDKEKWTSLPECEPVCDPPCLNGGNCLSFGRCQCPQDFRGPQCQFRTDNCIAKKLNFNGGYNCSGDQTSLSCAIHCPEGINLDGIPAPMYTCLYSEGVFKPQPIPQCVFPDPELVMRKYSSSSNYHSGLNSTYNLNSLTVNGLGGFPDVGYIPAGHRWDMYNSKTQQGFTVTTSDPLFVIRERIPEAGICMTWEGTHYKTFDGKVFSFESKCAHTLVSDSIDNTFSVIAQNDPDCPLGKICPKIVQIYLDTKGYTLKQSPEGIPILSTPKKRLPIPAQLPGLRVEMSAHYIIASLDSVGTKIRWDGQQLVQIEVQESLWNRTSGLCGNLDGDPNNDFQDKNGNLQRTISNFASSWKVQSLENECSELPSEQHPCMDDGIKGSKSHLATSFCKKLLNDPRFAPCHSIIDVFLLLEACKWDYCSCPKQNPSVCACETLNVYVRACSHKGVKNLANWRDQNTCPMQCTNGKIYKSCGTHGQAVCGETTLQEEENQEHCIEGCYCPSGTVLHENRCITKDKCPCRLRTKVFPPGAEVPKECNTCTCTDGKWVCTKLSCGSRCSAIGDPHYVTFDGKKYDFMGQCSYYLVKTPTFSIEGENVACSGAISLNFNYPANNGLPSCTKTVTIRYGGTVIKLKQNQVIVVNGEDLTKIPYQIAGISIRSVSSIFQQVELPNGMMVWWDGSTRAYIDIPANFKEKTRGLCGTFNGNQKDDFLTPEEDIEQSVIPFANKWKTNEKCNDIPDIIKSHPCSANFQNQPIAEKHCQKIKSDLFSSCHWLVDPEPFYQDCLYDMCSCEYKAAKCFCPTIAAYAEECTRQGVKISWRDQVTECGIHCPNGQKYQVCGNTCTRTCFDVSSRPDCKPQCVEGCNCPEGEALDDNGQCIPIGQCKCQYEGLQFHPGYQEVRAASKGPELCTCINALWSCRLASEEEQKKFPKADDLKSLCSASENMEFTTCEPAEPITCKNMHSPDYYSATICHAGCKCKEKYVLDTSSKKCIKPSECPCHHGGKSYKENEIVQNDCNTCKCQNGKWKCTDRPCAAECSTWGDSHFQTFDGKHYDFQGQCDYVLSKGSLGSDSYDISIQNVPCGSLGTTCSKSLTIRVKSGEDQDTVTFTKEKTLPSFTSMRHLTIRKKGIFIITEAPDLGLVVNWDQGTRVYVRLDPRWKDKVKGLCGNFNDNDADDFQTPSGGITEVSPLIFGDSWKLQSYCPETTEITSTCEERPDRKVWALKQCGHLKTSLFSRCHSEVNVDIYFEKCIFDACACDQGGDCECLCTALAAYAQECNSRGVPLKWRSQKLCPMQCDEKCSNYSPCISTCPIETCDNLLTASQMSRLCTEDTCIEGCTPKPCPEGHIYVNSSFSDCVPRNICKPFCMEIDGKSYSEGDFIEGDDCHSCHCSRGAKICKGQPCTTVTTKAPHQLEQLVKCESGWSEWINQDKAKPKKTKTTKTTRKQSDIEPLPTPLILNNLRGGKCTTNQIVDIQCRTVRTHVPSKDTGLDVECSLERGLVCKTENKFKMCQDFEIRVLCQCEEIPTTPASTECDPVKPHKEHPTNCHIFYHCEPGPDGLKYVEKTCGPSMYYNPVTMICDWPYSVEEIKPECKAPTTTQLIEEISHEKVVVPHVEAESGTVCPPGTRKHDCAIECDRLCLYYSYIVKSEGLCKNDEKCEANCVRTDRPECPKGMFWSDNSTCVSLQDCLCKSNDGRPVKPGVVYRESDCLVCQCIDNYYTCDDSACRVTEEAEVEPEAALPEFIIGQGHVTKSPVFIEESIVTYKPGYTEMREHAVALLSTVTPPEKCDEDHFISLIQGDQALPSVTFNASSVLSPAFKPENAKFNSKIDGKSGGSWVPEYSNLLQYLEINLGQQEPIYGIRIKGSPMYDEYVTSYKISYSPDENTNFLLVLNKEKLPQVFRGSVDTNTPVEEVFDTPFEARIVRIHPETWHTGIALKVEVIGCGELSSTTVPYEIITVHPFTTTVAPLMCDDPMGLDNGMMADQQVSVSSEIDREHDKTSLKLSNEHSWQPVTNSPSEFVQFDLLEPRNVTGLVIKGGPHGWVTAFMVKYSSDGTNWNPIMDKKIQSEKTFLGNFDSDTPKTNYFDLPISTQFIKIIPSKWNEEIQLRVELHGCFEPYPILPNWFTTIVPESCNICPNVLAEPLEMDACRCTKDKWWDGENCVARTECPCFVGDISYPVGTPFKQEDCSECLCKLGGVTHCTPKHCPPCEKGLRSTVTTTCQCNCQPCSSGTNLCPTSNICINTTLWCNGVQDCPDDETGCTTPKPIVTTTPAPEETCPEVNCPPGFIKKVKKPTKGRKYQSSMFGNYGQPSKSKYNSGVKTSFVKRPVLQKPSIEVPKNKKNCTEYVCVSTKPPPKYIHTKKECPSASCPPGFIPSLENEDYTTKTCPEFICNPAPLPDSVCNVTGRTFNTFDGTEYKYDICNHILARDLVNGDWEVGVRKQCTKSCWRELVINHLEHTFVLHPNLTAEYDGFSYNVAQTKKIGSNSKSFSITRVGNTLLFVSNRYGFWVIWDKEGNIKLGVTRKLLEQVDGLCGYFNQRPEDDKRKPDGSPTRTTIEFGNSWAQEPQNCQPQTCPVDVQNKAWQICQIKHQVLEPCNRIVDKDAFVSRCIETTCDCLQAAGGKHEAEEACRCHTLQDFVIECLTRQPSVDISEWRVDLDCPATCEAPLIYYDCYQRKCEPNCDSLIDIEATCPKIPNVCFPGCYCPPGTVKKGDKCISPSNCRDCECNVLPHLQYVTYDETNFTINANCVYVMSRDEVPGGTPHKFQVLITNAPCKNNEKKMCVGKVTILYENKKIHVIRDMIRDKLKMIVDGERIDDFSDVTWAKIEESTSKHMKIHLNEISVDISVYFPSLGVSVKTSSQKYGGKLEGLCGNCDGNPADDQRTPSGEVMQNTNEFALSWLYEKLPQTKKMCENIEEVCPPLPKDSDPCTLILDYKTFGQCLRVLDPSLFVEWCRKDTCDNHPELACGAIEAYARDCASAGFCINWRNNLCPPKECPSDKIYDPCGPKCPKTCQEQVKKCPNVPVEGCYCPEGKILRNETCVVKEDCEVCDSEGHKPGDLWKKDKCTECTCEGTSVHCEAQRCSDGDKICEEGYQVIRIPGKEDECCDKFACVPEPTAGPTCEPPQPISCTGSGQIMKLATKPSGCQHFICECKPQDECEAIDLTTEQPLEDGYTKTIDNSGCCPEVKVICKEELCPKPKQCQQFHTLKNETRECCPLYTCEPPKQKCIYETQYISAENGGERPRTELEKGKFLKNANETWQDGPCRQCTCSLSSIGNYQASCTQTDCSAIEISNDYLDYELVPEFIYDQCCPNIKRIACKHNDKIYQVGETWTKDRDFCTIYECVNGTNGVQKETTVTHCDTNCELGFEYIPALSDSKQCCGSCKPYACVLDGKIHKIGDEWTSPDHCVKFYCLNLNGSMQVQSVKVSCPELPPDYINDYIFESIEIEGECCKQHNVKACKVGGRIVQIGETVQSPDDKCKKISCIKNEKGDVTKQETIESCKTDCPKGSEYKESQESCCGECIKVACVVEDTLKQRGESWTSPDNCTTYTCEQLADEFLVNSQQESCPNIDDCLKENIYKKGCCLHCNMTASSQKECVAETMALNKTIGLIKTHREDHGKCINKEQIKGFTECIGICQSSTYFDLSKGSHESKCSCCQVTKYGRIEVNLVCEDGFTYKKTIAVPSDCGCQGCGGQNFTKNKKTSSIK